MAASADGGGEAELNDELEPTGESSVRARDTNTEDRAETGLTCDEPKLGDCDVKALWQVRGWAWEMKTKRGARR